MTVYNDTVSHIQSDQIDYHAKHSNTVLCNKRQAQRIIAFTKDLFEDLLMKAMNLEMVDGPLFFDKRKGLHDELNGVEAPVTFKTPKGVELSIVQSLAKWKRYALHHMKFEPNSGLVIRMNAIRPSEDLDCMHSYLVRQWDWERVILREQRTELVLKECVNALYSCLLKLDKRLTFQFGFSETLLKSEEIFFITSESLLLRYPDVKSAKERENLICQEKGAVFLMQIGCKLSNGEIHDGRAADYDDWSLNGDILVWNPVISSAFELSSMGIRVDADSLESQLKEKGEFEQKKDLAYHQNILNGTYPLTVGGGIGQCRLCMFFLRASHIGQMHSSFWNNDGQAENLYL